MNVFRELALSTWNFKSYRQFIQNKGGRVFGFSALMLGIYLLITTASAAFGFLSFASTFQTEVMEQIPDFVLEDGVLTVDGTVDLASYNSYVYINTDDHIDSERAKAIFRTYDSVILIDDTRIALKSNSGEFQALTHAELQEAVGRDRFTQDDLEDLIPRVMPYVNLILLIVFVCMTVGRIMAFYIRIVVVSLAVLVIGSMLKMGLLYREAFKVAVYTRTIPVLVRLLLSVTGISIPFFWLMDIAFSSFYAYLALYEIREGMRNG